MALSEEPARGGRPQSQMPNHEAEPSHVSTGLNEAVDMLKMIVMNEQFCPEILPFQSDAVEVMRSLVKQQTDFLDQEEDTVSQGLSFESQLKRMEIDRINYLLRHYYRVRIKKIEHFVLFLFKDSATYDLLSPHEQKYAVGYSDLIEDHFKKSFLSMLPPKVQVLDKDGSVDHATAPNLDRFVFCKVLNTVGRIAVGEEATDDALDLSQGDILCIRYKGIRELLKNEDLQLI